MSWAGFGAHDHIAKCFSVLDVEQEHASHDVDVHKSNRGSLAIKEGNGPQFVLVTNGIRVAAAFYSLILEVGTYSGLFYVSATGWIMTDIKRGGRAPTPCWLMQGESGGGRSPKH